MNVNVSRYFWPVKGIYGPFLWPKCPPSFKSPSRVTQPFLFILRSHHNLKGKVVPKMGKSRPVKSDIRYEESFFQEQGNQTGELPLCIKHLPFGKIICSGVFDILSSTLESSSSSWPHLYPLGLSRALRQARLPSAYKCISCP